MKIVVIGGHGRIGSKIVGRLGEHGHEAVAADLSTGVNTLTGEGLAEAFEHFQKVTRSYWPVPCCSSRGTWPSPATPVLRSGV